MTNNNADELDALAEESESILEQAHAILNRIKQSREGQPQRVAKARSEADEARGWSLIEEPWETLITALPAHDAEGNRTGNALVLPSIIAKELFAARLAFDMLDAGLDAETDPDKIDDVKQRYFELLNGDTGLLFLVCMAAIDTIATVVVPQMVDELETQASNYDVRVMLAEARTKSWNGRVSEIRETSEELKEHGVKPLDKYDLRSAAFDPDAEGPGTDA